MKLLRLFPLTVILAVSWLALITVVSSGSWSAVLVPLAIPAYVGVVGIGVAAAIGGLEVSMSLGAGVAVLAAVLIDRFLVPVFFWRGESKQSAGSQVS